jgi:hypothetical protein
VLHIGFKTEDWVQNGVHNKKGLNKSHERSEVHKSELQPNACYRTGPKLKKMKKEKRLMIVPSRIKDNIIAL